MTVKAIIAQSEDNGIGLEGGLPWRIRAELKHFQSTTMGGTLLVGSKTWASMAGINLGNRKVIVITSKATELTCATYRQLGKVPDSNVIYCDDIFGTLNKYARSNETLWVIGGKTIYEQAAPYISSVMLTRVHETLPADTYFDILATIRNLVPSSKVTYNEEEGDTPNWSVTEMYIQAYSPPPVTMLRIDELVNSVTSDKPLPPALLKKQEELEALDSRDYNKLETLASDYLGQMAMFIANHENYKRTVLGDVQLKAASKKHHRIIKELLFEHFNLVPRTAIHSYTVVDIFNVGLNGSARTKAFISHSIATRNSIDARKHILFPDGVKSLSIKTVEKLLKYNRQDIVVINLPKHMHSLVTQALTNLGYVITVIFK